MYISVFSCHYMMPLIPYARHIVVNTHTCTYEPLKRGVSDIELRLLTLLIFRVLQYLKYTRIFVYLSNVSKSIFCMYLLINCILTYEIFLFDICFNNPPYDIYKTIHLTSDRRQQMFQYDLFHSVSWLYSYNNLLFTTNTLIQFLIYYSALTNKFVIFIHMP